MPFLFPACPDSRGSTVYTKYCLIWSAKILGNCDVLRNWILGCRGDFVNCKRCRPRNSWINPSSRLVEYFDRTVWRETQWRSGPVHEIAESLHTWYSHSEILAIKIIWLKNLHFITQSNIYYTLVLRLFRRFDLQITFYLLFPNFYCHKYMSFTLYIESFSF